MRRHRQLHAALLVTLLALAGCAGSADRSTTPDRSGTDRLPTVTVLRSGGFAGVQDTTTVRPDGGWTSTDRAGAERTGQLTADQRHRLVDLATDPKLAGEARRPLPSGDNVCHDTFTYQVKVDDLQVNYSDCPTSGDQPPTAMAIAALLQSATGG